MSVKGGGRRKSPIKDFVVMVSQDQDDTEDLPEPPSVNRTGPSTSEIFAGIVEENNKTPSIVGGECKITEQDEQAARAIMASSRIIGRDLNDID